MFNQAISLDPGNARSHYNLALAYESLYEYDFAILEYQFHLNLTIISGQLITTLADCFDLSK